MKANNVCKSLFGRRASKRARMLLILGSLIILAGTAIAWNGGTWTFPYTGSTSDSNGTAFSVTNTGTGSSIAISGAGGAYGVIGSGSVNGVQGNSSASGGYAVVGLSTAASGAGIGVQAVGYSPTGYGLWANNAATTGVPIAIYGTTAAASGISVYGQVSGSDSVALYGTGGTYGVYATGSGYGGSFEAESNSGIGVFGDFFYSSGSGIGGYGVKGQSNASNGAGVYGIGSGGYGVEGVSSASGSAGVYGSGGSSAYGVYGTNSTGSDAGVFGSSTGSNGTGVWGKADSGATAVGVYGESTNGAAIYGTSSSGYAAYFNGNVTINGGTCNILGTLNKPSGSFKIDHPLDPANKFLYHSFVESPDMKNIYDGVAVLDANGKAQVKMPDYFQALNKDFRYQLTAIGAPGPDLYVAQEITNNQFQIAGGKPGMKVSWMVTGIRHDAYANAHRIQVEVEKPVNERGKYLYPVELGFSKKLGIYYTKPIRARMARASSDREPISSHRHAGIPPPPVVPSFARTVARRP